jgi:hypothetical protein
MFTLFSTQITTAYFLHSLTQKDNCGCKYYIKKKNKTYDIDECRTESESESSMLDTAALLVETRLNNLKLILTTGIQ